MDAQLFESLRQKYGEDEIQAWVEVCDRFVHLWSQIIVLTYTSYLSVLYNQTFREKGKGG